MNEKQWQTKLVEFQVGLEAILKAAKPRNDFEREYYAKLRFLHANPKLISGFTLMASAIYKEDGQHQRSWEDYECGFASRMLQKYGNSSAILDIGSYTQFILGLTTAYYVTSVDVRNKKVFATEEVIEANATNLPFEDESFEIITSLCTLEHLGLGRYGDTFDLDADIVAFKEMRRVLAPDGILIFSTNFGEYPMMQFNNARVYSYEMIHRFCDGLILLNEEFYSCVKNDFVSLEECSQLSNGSDVYCGCWRK